MQRTTDERRKRLRRLTILVALTVTACGADGGSQGDHSDDGVSGFASGTSGMSAVGRSGAPAGGSTGASGAPLGAESGSSGRGGITAAGGNPSGGGPHAAGGSAGDAALGGVAGLGGTRASGGVSGSAGDVGGAGGSRAGVGGAGGSRAGVGGGAAGAARAGDGGVGGSSGASGGLPLPRYRAVGDPIELAGLVNASDIAWKPASNSFFVLINGDDTFYEYDESFEAPIRVIRLVEAPADAEGLAYLGPSGGVDRFAMSTESPDNTVIVFELDPAATSVDLSRATLHRYEPLAPSQANKGLEGVAYRPPQGAEPGFFFVCQEGQPGQVPIRVLGFESTSVPAATYRDGSLAVEEPWSAADELGGAAGDLSGLHYDVASDTLLVISHLGSRVLRVRPATGAVLDELVLSRSPQYEGVTLASGGRLVVVSEPNFIEIFQAN